MQDLGKISVETPVHAISERDMFNALNSSKKGLSQVYAESLLKKYGENTIFVREHDGLINIFFRQFNSLTVLLLFSSILAFFVGHNIDGTGIFIAALISVFLGFLQEFKAEQSLNALYALSAPKATVLRDSKQIQVQASHIVPGDIILLSSGDLIPADCRLIDGTQVQVDQSTLSGESHAVNKISCTLTKKTPLASRRNILYAGTLIVKGDATAIVFATAKKTEFGKIAQRLSEVKSVPTPLAKNLNDIGDKVARIAMFLAVIFFVVGLLSGQDFVDMFISAISLFVAAVPEGLPTVLAITLAIGVNSMAKQNALVRKMQSVETMGSVTVICTDKTGTITQNKMEVLRLYSNFIDFKKSDLKFESSMAPSKTSNSKKEKLNEYECSVHFLLSCASMCCSAFVPFASKSASLMHNDKQGLMQSRGDPTEIAILESADFCNVNRKALFEKNVLVSEQPFDYKKKYMINVRQNSKKYSVYMKGAPEAVLSNCTYIFENSKIRKINKKDIQKINSTFTSYSKEGLRVLAVAYAESILKKDVNNSKFSNLCWVGLIGLIDPPRPQVYDAISACTTAGIRTVMLTGDSQLTACAIANQIGITISKKNIISGDEIEKMSDYDLRALVKNLVLCYRATPDHKFRIINALQQVGEIVAVTGDGVNDAPSIKKADIGIAMGVGGTDVARSASDLILLDNNFNTLVKAIEYGRSIFANILSFVRFQFTTNVAAITLMFTSPLLGLGLPLTPLQILWVNIIMDGPPALALGVEPPKEDSMLVPPRNPKKPLLSIDRWMTIFISAFLMAILTLIVFYAYLKTQPYKAQTMAFCTFVILQLANALNCRSYTLSVFNKFFSNKILLFALLLTLIAQISIVYISEIGIYFHTLTLNVFDWSLIFSLGILIIVWGECRKLIFAKFNSKSQVS